MTSGVCEYPPPTQGLDAYVFELPDSFGDGFHLIDVQLVPDIPEDPRPDVDLYFLSADCAPTGDIASTAPARRDDPDGLEVRGRPSSTRPGPAR